MRIDPPIRHAASGVPADRALEHEVRLLVGVADDLDGYAGRSRQPSRGRKDQARLRRVDRDAARRPFRDQAYRRANRVEARIDARRFVIPLGLHASTVASSAKRKRALAPLRTLKKRSSRSLRARELIGVTHTVANARLRHDQSAEPAVASAWVSFFLMAATWTWR